jgi:hypothetical protein
MTDETTTPETDDAPYGYKADGTPYKRRPRSPEASAQAVATRRKKTSSGNGAGSWTESISVLADSIDSDADKLEQAAADLRDVAARIRG